LKGHLAIDPDAEIITATAVTPGNAGDASVAEELISDLAEETEPDEDPPVKEDNQPAVYGDNAYGTGEFQSRLEEENIESRCKTQAPTAAGGMFRKDRFEIDLGVGSVTCPNGVSVAIRSHKDGSGAAYFASACADCPLRPECTNSPGGRTIGISRHEGSLGRARARQKDPGWIADYRSTRPKVERKIGHLMRRRHGGRRARMRGSQRVAADFSLLAAAANLARLAVLGMYWHPAGAWTVS
jgi:hypothetical protein